MTEPKDFISNLLDYLVIYDYYDMPLTAIMQGKDGLLWYINLVDYDRANHQDIWLVVETTEEMMRQLTDATISHRDMILSGEGLYYQIKGTSVTKLKKIQLLEEWLPAEDSYVDGIYYLKEEK